MGHHYYPQYFINKISGLSARQLGNRTTTFVNTLAPVKGSNSVKVQSLNNLLGGQLTQIIAGRGQFRTFGRSARSRVLKALRLRKNGITFG